MRRAAETAFLPAALEILETPPSPLGRAILWSIIGFFTVAVTWASLSEVDIVAVAQGRIIPSGHSKKVQPLEFGTVTAINVTEGQAVRAGDVLIELDPSRSSADVARWSTEREDARIEVRRLQQLDEWLRQHEAAGEPASRAANDPLLDQQWREFQDRISVLEREQDRRRAELARARQQLAKLEALLPIITRRAEDQKALSQQKLLPEQQYLLTEQERLENFHEVLAQRSRLEELGKTIDEIDARKGAAYSEFHRQVLERLQAAQRRLAAGEQEWIKADSRNKAQKITAPVDGVVQQLAVHNVGAIVTPAQELMLIVPLSESLEVEATLANRDIGFVEVGQRVEIKIDTFPFTRYGTVAGEVIGLSTDAVTDAKQGLVYKMRVRMERSQIDVGGRRVALGPGMAVTVESKTGARRVIEYFLSPLLRYRDESMRER